MLKSMTQLNDEQSFALRERLFDAHAEAVMNSIAGHDSERAWALRGGVIVHLQDEITGQQLSSAATQ